MKLINLNSKKGVVNLFADFILKYINPSLNTVIKVTDLTHFFVINGMTESTELLDLNKLKDEFISEYQTLLSDVGYGDKINLMDLIQYNKNPNESSNRQLWSTFYNSSRPLYHPEVLLASKSDKDCYSIDYNDGLVYELDGNSIVSPSKFYVTPFQTTSEFPHGYSLSMDRALLYYSEYIVNQIMTPSMSNKIDLYLTTKKNDEGDQIIDIKFTSPISEETIKSMILDVFTFDLPKFIKTIGGYDLCDDIKKPTESKPWLVNDINPKDLIVF